MTKAIAIDFIDTLQRRKTHLCQMLQEHDDKCAFTEATANQLRGELYGINCMLTDISHYIITLPTIINIGSGK